MTKQAGPFDDLIPPQNRAPNPFDQFDPPAPGREWEDAPAWEDAPRRADLSQMSDDELMRIAGVQPRSRANPFDQFDAPAKPKPIGQAANADFLRAELRNADPFTRNLAGFGVAASDTWEGLKQWFGKGDRDRIEANKVIRQEAPIGSVAGEVALTAIPFGAAGNSVRGAAKVGAAYGATRPTDADGLEGWLERGKNTTVDAALSGVGQKVANSVGKWVSDRHAQKTNASRSQNAVRDQTLREGREAGFVATPSSVNPSWWNRLEESIGGKTATAQQASNINEPLFARAARRDLHLSDDVPLTPETMQTARDLAYQAGYKPLADAPAINWDHKLAVDLRTLMPGKAGGAVKSPGHAEIGELVESLGSRGQWTGEQLIQDIRQLRENANSHFRSSSAGERDLARAEKQAAKYLEDMAERNLRILGGDPNAVQLLREAREYIAKTYTVEKSINPATAAIDPRSWARRIKDGKPMGGEMEVAGKFALAFPKASQPLAQIAGPGVNKLSAFMWPGLAGTAGASMGGAEGGVVGTAFGMLGPPAARRHLLSQRKQQNMLRDLYELGAPTRAGVNALRMLKYSPIGLTDP